MRVAFIGHAWHRKTGSSRFLTELLEREATVEYWWGEPGNAATKYWAAEFHEDRYDVIIIWQLHEAFELLSGRHPNVVFVPMYDAMLWGGELFWKQAFNSAKIVCFSWKLRQEVMRRGAMHAGFQYYPDPARYVPVDDFTSLRGFLWYRRREISPDMVFNLSEGTEFASFTVHDAPDPDNAAGHPWIAPVNIHRFNRTGWTEDGEAYTQALREANVFFAPRPLEGIGMSLLEAMASGHCVVAPNAPTMNEYVSHGTNGLLYVPRRPTRLDFADARTLGARARESVERGHQRWLTSIPDLLDFIATPIARLSGQPIVPVRNRAAASPAPDFRVSVVTVCHDDAAELEATMTSVLAQTGCDFEYMVIDRGSTDGSSDIIRRHADRLAAWRSEPDEGPADAINSALNLIRGDWVLFLNAGDAFASEDALRRMFAGLPAGAAVVYGHHIRVHEDGTEQLHRAAEFETTWSRLQRGDLWLDWLAGLPGQSAVSIRRDLIARSPFNSKLGLAACLDRLFQARIEGERLFNCDEVIAIVRPPRAPSPRGQGWADAARLYGDAAAVDRLLGQPGEATASTTIVARLGRLALRTFTVLDRHAPALAQAIERTVRGTMVRALVRGLLARTSARSEPTTQTRRLT